MVDQVKAGKDSLGHSEAPAWRPSRVPTHRDLGASEGRIVERQEDGGFLAALGRFIKRPFVRLLIGLGIFILAAVVYDATVNFGDWTIKKEKPKATDHRGLPGLPQTPEG